MIQYHTIADQEDEIKLTVGIDDDGKIFMPSILFTNVQDPDIKEFKLYWDNEHYIFNEFYQFLKRYNEDNFTPEDEVEFKDIWPILTKDLGEELLAMLELALKQNWYEHKLNN